MPSKLRTLGLAVMAAIAMSAAGASVASAQTLEAEFGSFSGTTTATSTTHLWTFGGLSGTCPHVEFEGTFTSPAKTLFLSPKNSTPCTVFALGSSHIINNGCSFDLTLNNAHSEGLTRTSAAVRLECGGSGSITFTPTVPIFGTSACTVHMSTQNLKGSLDLKINTAPAVDDLTIGPNTLGNAAGPDGITYTITEAGHTPLCPAAGHYGNGAYDISATTVRAFSDAAHMAQVRIGLVTK